MEVNNGYAIPSRDRSISEKTKETREQITEHYNDWNKE
jgi:hypothetical protein